MVAVCAAQGHLNGAAQCWACGCWCCCDGVLVHLVRVLVLTLLARTRVLVQLVLALVPMPPAHARVLVQLACAVVLSLQGQRT